LCNIDAALSMLKELWYVDMLNPYQ
jgi:hypothetical protein